MEQIVLGGGCFWCTEAAYQLVKGVENVVPGYAGGKSKSPSYRNIHNPDSDHAEVIKITFDPEVISLKDILEIFWVIHDPTTPNQQGNDMGPAYRSIILFNNEVQKKIIDQSLTEAQKPWDNKIVTQVAPLEKFYEAEPEHHDFYKKNPQLGYCQVIINPKLAKFREKFSSKLKK